MYVTKINAKSLKRTTTIDKKTLKYIYGPELSFYSVSVSKAPFSIPGGGLSSS